MTEPVSNPYKLVPVKPTLAMILAATDKCNPVGCCSLMPDHAREIWKAMLAASPQGESSSAHPAPIKPSGDTGELRERVAQIIEAAIERHNPGNSLRHTIDDADAILDLIQSERAGPRVSILSTKFVGDNTNGQPIFEGGADGVTNITLHGWTCFGPDEAGQKALAGFQSERAE